MRTFPRAKAFAQNEHVHPSMDWYMWCQVFSRQCVGAPPFGTSARHAFEGTPNTHRHTTSPPPPGAIAYYGKPGVGAGHAVFVVEAGMVWSTDIRHKGKVDKVPWDVFPEHSPDGWSLPYRGWIDWCPAGALPVQQVAHPVLGGVSEYRRGKKVYRSRMRLGQADSDSVWNLQVALIAHGAVLPHGPSATYDTATRDACAAFELRQGWSGSDANGIAGPQTVRKLGLVWVAA